MEKPNDQEVQETEEQESMVDDQLNFDDAELGDAYYKLVEMKKARVAAQENKQKLENRINLLTKEQQKVMKKVEAVRKKAQEIMKIKQRNEEMQRKREELELKRLQELQERQQLVVNMRAEHEENINKSRQQQIATSQTFAKTTREQLLVG